MSFKSFSESQATPSSGKTDDKTKAAGAQPASQPGKKQDEAAPARKP